MGERMDRALALAERFVLAVEGLRDALDRIATEPSGKLPARRSTQRRASRPHVPEIEPDDVSRQRARRMLEKAGLR